MSEQQNYSNHAKFFPPFHFVAAPIFLFYLGWCIYRWIHLGTHAETVVNTVVAVGLLVGLLSSRMMALAVQDRVIRLEERLRMERLLPADLKARIGELTTSQFVALRFASDAELPALTRKVLDEKLDNRKAIKQLVQSWRPDYLRA